MGTFTASAALWLVLLGFAVGTFGTLVGAGGGFILTPVLLVIYPHDSPQTITAISIAVVFFNAASGSLAYARQRRTDYRSGAVFAVATLPGAVLGALAVGHVSRALFDGIMVVVLAAAGGWLLLGSRAPRHPRAGGTPRSLTDRDGVEHVYRVHMGRGALLSVAVGFASSFLGIGGGIIHVPLLVQVLGFPVHVATATSHFVLAVMSGTATVTHVLQGSYHVGHGLRRTAALSIGVIGGAQLGAHISRRLSGVLIQRLLAVALLLLCVRLVVTLV